MDRLAIIGAGWRRLGTRGLERFTLDADSWQESLPELKAALDVQELVYLATCNRVEIIFARDRSRLADLPLAELRRRAFIELTGQDPAPGEAEKSLQAWDGEGALEHLLLVTCGLDSAQLGEREIRGQLRQSLERATELGLTGPLLKWSIGRAMRQAREIEKQTSLADGRTSMPGIGAEAIFEHIASAPGLTSDFPPDASPDTVALVGVSAMTERCGEVLKARGVALRVINRSEERGRAMARRLGADFLPLAEFLRSPVPITALVTATGASLPIFDASALKRVVSQAKRAPLVVDYGVPPDVDPKATQRLSLRRIDMEEISSRAEANRQRRQADVAVAREHVDRALVELRKEAADLALAPVLAELSGRYRETANERLDRLLRRRLSHLGAAERELLERFALDLAKRFAHVPVVGLKALAGEFGLDAADIFLSASDPERAWGLRDENDTQEAR